MNELFIPICLRCQVQKLPKDVIAILKQRENIPDTDRNRTKGKYLALQYDVLDAVAAVLKVHYDSDHPETPPLYLIVGQGEAAYRSVPTMVYHPVIPLDEMFGKQAQLPSTETLFEIYDGENHRRILVPNRPILLSTPPITHHRPPRSNP